MSRIVHNLHADSMHTPWQRGCITKMLHGGAFSPAAAADLLSGQPECPAGPACGQHACGTPRPRIAHPPAQCSLHYILLNLPTHIISAFLAPPVTKQALRLPLTRHLHSSCQAKPSIDDFKSACDSLQVEDSRGTCCWASAGP